ncbi:unnamed protein product, partial [Candidula unifasciata]
CVDVCSRCKMYYCSNVCQKMDWPRHMEICTAIRQFYENDADLSSIPHGNILHSSNSAFFDDLENSHSQMRMTHRNGRSHSSSSSSSMFEEKGQEMSHFKENNNGISSTSNEHVGRYRGPSTSSQHADRYRGPSTSSQHADRYRGPPTNTEQVDRYHGTYDDHAEFPRRSTSPKHFDYYHGPSATVEHLDPSLKAAEAQNFSKDMFKNNFNKTESQKGKTVFSDESVQLKIVSSNNNSKKNVPSSHERAFHRHQDERSNTPVSQKGSKPAYNRNNSNSRNVETKEAFPRTQAVPVSSNQQTRVKDIVPPMKTRGEETVANKRNQDFQSKQKEDKITPVAVEKSEKLSAVELTLAVKSSGQCYLTYFESPYKFWISLEEYLDVFTENSRIMEKAISENGTTPAVIKVGETYGVMFMAEWCRVTVTSVKGKEITVFFVDFGNQATVKQEDLRLLTVEMLQLPAQAVCCCISKLKPKGCDSWSEAASLAAQQWLGAPLSKFLQFEVVAKRGSVHAVNISYKKETMSGVLLAGGFGEKVDTEPGLPSLTSSTARIMAASLKSRIDGMKNGLQITGEFTDFTSSDRFIVVDLAAAELMAELTSTLQAEYKNSTVPYRPVQGELVAAQFSADGSWYRAEVTNIDGDSCTLYFVDYGNSEVQKVENIRQLTNKFLIETPKQALVCSLSTAQPLSRYESKIVDEEFRKLLGSALSIEGNVSMLVKGKTNEALLVDILNQSEQSLSDQLIDKLSELSIQTQNTHSEVGKNESQTNKLPSTPSKVVLEKMATLSELGKETLAMEIGATVSVVVSSCESSAEFYVRLNNKCGLFIDMMKKLDKSIASSPRLTAPSVGSLAAVLFSEHHIWCRGVVESIEGSKCSVRFIDYGNSEEKLLSALKVLPSSVCDLPAQAIRCRLEGRLQTSPVFDQKFKDVMKQSAVDVKVCENDSGGFSVHVFQDGVDIGAALLDSCSQPTVEPVSAVKNPTTVLVIPMETLPATGEPVAAVVTHIDSFSKLFITCKDVTEVMIQLFRSADSLPVLSNPAVGAACAAQYSQDSTWYRARIVGIKSPKTCIVQFLDYGNSEETSMSNLRELGPDLSKLPGQAICCCLFGYEPESGSQRPMSDATEMINKLRLELLEKTVTVRVVDRKSDTWIVKLENEHGECINTKYQPASSAITSTPKLSDITFEHPPDTEFEAVIIHINSLSDFYCQMYDAEKLTELDTLSEHLRDDVSRLGENIQLDPVVNGVYTSQFMGTWYRCVVEEVRNTHVLIRYIDYGNSEEILASQLRPLCPERLKLPVRLQRCRLNGVIPVHENWSNPDMPAYLAILRQNKVDLVIESRDADVFHVSLFILQDGEKINVAADLVNIGLAKFLQVVSPQKDESKSLTSGPQKPEQSANEQDEEGDDAENIDELRRQFEELQLKLKMAEEKKKKK